jgi:hypothetical protein
MNYTVMHRTTYRYHSDVAYSRLVAHLVPRATLHQRPLSFEVNLSPEPVKSFERPDFFGNTTSWMTIDEPHAILDIFAESHVSVEPIPAYAPDASLRWENVRTAFEFPADPDTLDALQYTFDTRLTLPNDDVVAYARGSFQRAHDRDACLRTTRRRVSGSRARRTGLRALDGTRRALR